MVIKHRLGIFVRNAGQVDKLDVVGLGHLGLNSHQVIGIRFAQRVVGQQEACT